jgi:Ca2+-binding EF-hand superfamily protein
MRSSRASVARGPASGTPASPARGSVRFSSTADGVPPPAPSATTNDMIVQLLRQKDASELRSWLVSRHAELDSKIAELSAIVANPRASIPPPPTVRDPITHMADPPKSARLSVSRVDEVLATPALSLRLPQHSVPSPSHYTPLAVNTFVSNSIHTHSTASPKAAVSRGISHAADPSRPATPLPQPALPMPPPPPKPPVPMPSPPAIPTAPQQPPPEHHVPVALPAATTALQPSVQVLAMLPVSEPQKLAPAIAAASDGAQTVLVALRHELLPPGTSQSDREALRTKAERIFHDFDEQSKGALSAVDFADALMLLGSDLSTAGVTTLASGFALGPTTKQVDYGKFMIALMGDGIAVPDAPTAAERVATEPPVIPADTIASVEATPSKPSSEVQTQDLLGAPKLTTAPATTQPPSVEPTLAASASMEAPAASTTDFAMPVVGLVEAAVATQIATADSLAHDLASVPAIPEHAANASTSADTGPSDDATQAGPVRELAAPAPSTSVESGEKATEMTASAVNPRAAEDPAPVAAALPTAPAFTTFAQPSSAGLPETTLFQQPVFQAVSTTIDIFGQKQSVTILIPANFGTQAQPNTATLLPPAAPPPAPAQPSGWYPGAFMSQTANLGASLPTTVLADAKVRSNLASISGSLYADSIASLKARHARLQEVYDSAMHPSERRTASTSVPLLNMAPATASSSYQLVTTSAPPKVEQALHTPVPQMPLESLPVLPVIEAAHKSDSSVLATAVATSEPNGQVVSEPSAISAATNRSPPLESFPLPSSWTFEAVSIPAPKDFEGTDIACLAALRSAWNELAQQATVIRVLHVAAPPLASEAAAEGGKMKGSDSVVSHVPSAAVTTITPGPTDEGTQADPPPATVNEPLPRVDSEALSPKASPTAIATIAVVESLPLPSSAGAMIEILSSFAPKSISTTPPRQLTQHRDTKVEIKQAEDSASCQAETDLSIHGTALHRPVANQLSKKPTAPAKPALVVPAESGMLKSVNKPAVRPVDRPTIPQKEPLPGLLAGFPRATREEITLRNNIRDILARKLDAIGLGDSQEVVKTDQHMDVRVPKYIEELPPTAMEALNLAFERFEGKPTAVTSKSKKVEKLSKCISAFDFNRALMSLGVSLPASRVARVISALELDVDGRVSYQRFVLFVSCALDPPKPETRPAASSDEDYSLPPLSNLDSRIPLEKHVAAPASPTKRASVTATTDQLHSPAKYNPWGSSIDPLVAKQRPKFSAPLPLNILSPASPFWTAVNGLEAAFMQEVRKRATVRSVAKEPTPSFDVSARYGVTTEHPVAGAFILRRAFAFVDRNNRKRFSLDELHQLLAELRFVDPPARDTSMFESSSAIVVAEGAEIHSPHAKFAPEVRSPGRADMSRFHHDRLPSEHVSLEAQLSATARTLVAAVYRRIQGEGDPGVATATSMNAGISPSVFDADNPVLTRDITYSVFAKWAAPLNTKLRKVREAMNVNFKTAASLGGGGKNFVRAFKKFTAGSQLDKPIGPAGLRTLLGPAAHSLSDDEMQCLIDFYDENGNGCVDIDELFANTITGWDIKSIIRDALEEEDELVGTSRYVPGPVKHAP